MENRGQIELFGKLIFLGEEDQVKKMLAQKIDLGSQLSNGMTFLISAVEGDQPNLVELLLKNDANPNQQATASGMTALHWAVEYAMDGMIQNNQKHPYPESLKCIELLLRNGADRNVKDNEGKIPLDYSNTERIENLFEKY